MARNASTKTRKRTTKPAKPGLRDVLRGQGRSFVWLARQTGYSVTQISRVANGKHPGTEKFWKLMAVALGEEVAA